MESSPRIRRLAFALVVVLTAALPKLAFAENDCRPDRSYAVGLHGRMIDIDGTKRSFEVFIPETAYLENGRPLVLDLQASGISPSVELRITGLAEAAKQNGFIVVAPEAIRPFPKGGVTWNVPQESDQPSDMDFLARLIEQLRSDLCIGSDEVYAVGFSGGARMASELACRRPDLLAGIGAVGGLRHPQGLEGDCKPDDPPVDIIAFHSVADPVNPYDTASRKAPSYWTYGVEEALARWLRFNGCQPERKIFTDASNVAVRSFTGCRSGSRIEFYTLKNAGHVWPGSTFTFPGYLGASMPELPATDMMIEFFKLKEEEG